MFSTTSDRAEEPAATVEELVAAIQGRGLLLPALLLVAGHRPLAFWVGQGLLTLQPLAVIFGLDGWTQWSELLCRPGGPEALAARLSAGLKPGAPAVAKEETDAHG